MPTISSSQNIDQTTFTQNGETTTINFGATLTINSDFYWAQCGKVIGAIDHQGGFVVDGRDVWWVPFDASSGNVPSLPTFGTNTVTVSGTAVGEFLGVWDTFGKTIPMSAGTAMPTSGYVKLRRKVANIADNDVLTFANGATATVNSATGGQRGWITFASSGGGFHDVNHRNALFNVIGDWFELGTANGTAGQTLQHYCKDAISAIQVETGSGTGVYEWWSAVGTRANFTTTYFDTSDRCKVFDVSDTGLITFNGVGGTVGKLPVSGARIRVPNIHFLTYGSFGTGAGTISGRQMPGTITCTTTSTSVTGVSTTFDSSLVGLQLYNTSGTLIGVVASVASTTSLTLVANAAVAVTGGGFVTKESLLSRSSLTSGQTTYRPRVQTEATISLQYFAGQIRFYNNNGASTTIKYSALGGNQVLTVQAYQLIIDDCGIGMFSEQSVGSHTIYFIASSSDYVSNVKNVTLAGFTNENSPAINTTISLAAGTIENLTWWQPQTNGVAASVGGQNVTIKNCFFGKNISSNTQFVTFTGSNLLVQNIDLAMGRIGTPSNNYMININASGVYENFRMIFGKQLSYNNIQLGVTSGAVVIRNWGSPGARQDFGGQQFISGSVPELYLSKLYLVSPSSSFDISTATAKYFSEVDTSNTSTGPVNSFGFTNQDWRRVFYAQSAGANYGVNVGTHHLEKVDSVSAPTEIALWFWFNRYSTYQKSKLSQTAGPGLVFPDFSTSSSSLEVAGRYVTSETYYYMKGITGFVNANPTFLYTGNGSITYEYDLDRGTGFTGTYKTLTGANLSAETNISPTGLRMRVKATANNSVVGTFPGAPIIRATTNTTAFYNNQYGDKVVEHTISGIQTGSVAYMFRTDTGALVAKTREVVTGTLSLNPEWTTNIPVVFRLRDQGYNTITSSFTMTANGFNTPVTQIANTISTSVPGVWGITVTNHGASPVTWNSKQWSITITVPGGQTAAQIAQFIHYWLNQDAGTFDSSLPNAAFHDLIISSGTSFETARGTVYGSAGASLKGVRVVDGSGNEVPGFARMQADDGTYYSPAASYTLTVSNIINNSRILVRRTDTSAVIANQVVTTGSFAYTYTHTSDIPIEIVVRKGTASPYYQEWKTTTTLSNSNNTQTANQISDE